MFLLVYTGTVYMKYIIRVPKLDLDFLNCCNSTCSCKVDADDAMNCPDWEGRALQSTFVLESTSINTIYIYMEGLCFFPRKGFVLKTQPCFSSFKDSENISQTWSSFRWLS